ncbi:MAG: hypothetical protein HOM14_15710 [Gammaproteobacteria bacterium]|jgi:hypothetical protein|nr:hypothetical protein [Gammaproteobacteria bacterium]MBT3725625.1 hypothetical protein [Gammaproteobacteria bacterium]MBT4078443.1 hypothetical protein [Gammaproteobacteria bacterium]MBT4195652.1 hypothetical protein [Gammaproteobacteria bacterium]MBT4449551.1 hypothetical protein [Gammaproteobacteria bacterium]
MSRLIILVFYFSLFFNAACQQQEDYQSSAEEIFPPVTMKYAALNRMDNLPVSLTFFKDDWTMVVFGESSCSDNCLNRLALLNDVKSAKKLFVIDGLANHATLRELAGLFPNVAITMGVTASSFDRFYAQFDLDSIEPTQKQKMIYLVSPSAELVYSLDAEEITSSDLEKEIVLLN